MRKRRPNGPTVVVRAPARWKRYGGLLSNGASVTLATAAPKVRGEVGIVLVGDAAMRKLNAAYRGKNRATDVLSFKLSAGKQAGEPFGDVVVSVETAMRQAATYGATPAEEVLRLVIHGLLHLCGYRHDRPREARRMFALTQRLIGNVTRG